MIGGLIDQKIVDNEVGNNVKSKDVINQSSKKKRKLKLRPKHLVIISSGTKTSVRSNAPTSKPKSSFKKNSFIYFKNSSWFLVNSQGIFERFKIKNKKRCCWTLLLCGKVY